MTERVMNRGSAAEIEPIASNPPPHFAYKLTKTYTLCRICLFTAGPGPLFFGVEPVANDNQSELRG